MTMYQAAQKAEARRKEHLLLSPLAPEIPVARPTWQQCAPSRQTPLAELCQRCRNEDLTGVPGASCPSCSAVPIWALPGGSLCACRRCASKTEAPSHSIEILDLKNILKTAVREPERSHVKYFCATGFLNSLVHVSPATVPVHCRLRNAEESGVQSVECKVWSVKCGVWSVVCKV